MALPSPAWRVKSRPCPFYQQGRCLFADSCNFVHSASVQRLQSEQTSPQAPPQIIQGPTPEPAVHSPQSARSPPRSPRTAGILLALKGVIADDPDDILDDDTNKIPSQTPPSNSVFTESTNTVLTENNPKTIVTPTIKGTGTNREPENVHDENSPFVQPNEAHMRPVIRTIQSSPTEPGQDNFSPTRTADLLSPVDSVNLKLMTFNLGSPRTLPTCEEEVIDSGFAETFPISSRQAPSAPSSPLKATFGVLSSPFASPASRVLSPRLSAFIGHLPHDANEDESISDTSLDSLTGRYSREILGSEEYVVVDDSFEAESFEAHLNAVESQVQLQALQPNQAKETDEEYVPPEVQQVETNKTDVVESSTCASHHRSGSMSLSRVDGGDVIFNHSSPPALGPSISRSSSQDEDGEALSFSDLFVSNAAMESQTTVDFDGAEGENSPLGLIYAEYSDSPRSLDEGKDLGSPREAAHACSLELGPMPSPFSPVAPQEASPIPNDFLVEREASPPPSPESSPAIAYQRSPPPQREKTSLDHSVSVFSPATPSVEQHLPEQHSSPSVAFESFFSREDDEERLDEDIGEMRDFSNTLSPLPSPPLSYAKSPSPVPPVQEQLRPIPAPSESSMSMSALSPPIGLRPGSSQSRASRSIPTPDSLVPGVADPHTSRKVPFGFRHSVSKPLSKSAAPSRPVSIFQPPLTSQSERVSSPEEPATSPTNPNRSGLRPLRLSLVTGPLSAPSYNTSFSVNPSRNSIRSQRESLASLSASHVSIHNRLLSLSRTSIIPEQSANTNISHDDFASPLSSYSIARLKNFDDPRTAPLVQSASWLHTVEEGPSPTVESPVNNQIPSPLQHVEEDVERESADQALPLPSPFPVAPRSSSAQQVHRPPMYAIGTPKPTLMFAIASDDVGQVREVLERGDVNPNETLGPQSALEFALTNDQLTNKMEIVKTLLAFGADPKALHPKTSVSPRSTGSAGPSSPAKAVSSPPKALMEAIDPATRYYVERADASNTRRTSALIHRSFFRPLTRVRYELIGQDRALEELFKVLSIHSRQLSSTPIVVLLCGPSGHGKSLLARKFGTLLDVPTHTVNMTALDSTQDLWRSYSMSPYETPSMCTLAEFLINNEGKRCVVVLDEIEKTRDEKTLWSLLMPWELGRCTFEANGRPVDCRNVVWLGTSNVGHDLVLEHHQARPHPDLPVTREEYVDLMGLLRPRVSQRLGASILSRVTSVLPFVPFSTEEKRAICYEALHATGGDIIRSLSKDIVASMIDKALADYIADEGARSLHRAVSNQLLDNI